MTSGSLESSNHEAGFTAIVIPELNIIPATTAKKIIPFFLVFTVKIYIAILYLIPINMKILQEF
jgi:hypothetical protein